MNRSSSSGRTLAQCQLVETALLNIVNFQTLIGDQGCSWSARSLKMSLDGVRYTSCARDGCSYLGTRAAVIGGANGTSNVRAGKLWYSGFVEPVLML